MQKPLIKRTVVVLLIASVCVIAVGYLLISIGGYFWKVHQSAPEAYASGAKFHLLTLSSMQASYQMDHGGYAGNFSDLGVPQGARLQGNVLLWNGPYRIRFTRLVRNQGGNVVHYTIEAKPDDSDAKLPRIEMNDEGIFSP